jgi:large subunit ribosomal protein L21
MSEAMKYAIISTGGRQLTVQAGQKVLLDCVEGEAGSSVKLSNVLMLGEAGGASKIGSPIIEGASVTAKVLGPVKGEKLVAFKRKRRKGFKKKIGHRQRYTEVLIEAING